MREFWQNPENQWPVWWLIVARAGREYRGAWRARSRWPRTSMLCPMTSPKHSGCSRLSDETASRHAHTALVAGGQSVITGAGTRIHRRPRQCGVRERRQLVGDLVEAEPGQADASRGFRREADRRIFRESSANGG